MNNKQLIPLLVKFGVAGGILWALYSIFSDNEAEKKPETAVFRDIPSENSVKPVVTSVPTVIPAISAFVASKIPVPPPSTIPAAKIAPEIPLPAQKKTITRENMAEIFNHGGRKLDRKSAVAALKALGFGKSAAYEALLPDGRFAFWLQFALDGIIAWKG